MVGDEETVRVNLTGKIKILKFANSWHLFAFGFACLLIFMPEGGKYVIEFWCLESVTLFFDGMIVDLCENILAGRDAGLYVCQR